MTKIDPRTQKACAECLRVLDRAVAYAPRYIDDVHGVAYRENERRKKRKIALLTGDARLAYIQAADTSERALLVQPRCFECDRFRTRRIAFRNALKQRYPEAGLSTHLDKAGHRRLVLTGSLSPVEHAALVVEAGRRGIAILTATGALSAPEDDVAALKGAFALLTTSMRIGTLGPDREDAIKLIRERAPKVKSKLAAKAEDVIDTALVREGLGRDSDAFVRIMDRYRRHHAKQAWNLIRHRRKDEDWVWGRYNEAFLHGITKWNPLHKAALSSYIGNWVKRYLAPDRTRADRRMGVYKQEDGTWSKPAVSMFGTSRAGDSCASGVLESTYEPHAVSYSAGGAAPSPNADASEGFDATARSADISEALSALTETERTIAWRVFANREKQADVAADLGMTRSVLRVAMDDIAAKLRWRLSIGYREHVSTE